jgi:hypothetical protein
MPDHSCYTPNSYVTNWILRNETCGRTFGIRNSFYTAVNSNLMLCNSYGQVETYWFRLTIIFHAFASKFHWTGAQTATSIACFATLPLLIFPKEFNALTSYYDVSSLFNVSVSQTHALFTPTWYLRKVSQILAEHFVPQRSVMRTGYFFLSSTEILKIKVSVFFCGVRYKVKIICGKTFYYYYYYYYYYYVHHYLLHAGYLYVYSRDKTCP